VKVTPLEVPIEGVNERSANRTNAGTPSKRKPGSRAADLGPSVRSVMIPREIARQ
jgi:hypothetical protein